MEPELEPQRHATPPLKLIFEIGGLSKMSQIITFSYCCYSISIKRNQEKKLPISYVSICFFFNKFGLVYSRDGAGAGAASKFLPGAGAASF
jgi:hypothetical protein